MKVLEGSPISPGFAGGIAIVFIEKWSLKGGRPQLKEVIYFHFLLVR